MERIKQVEGNATEAQNCCAPAGKRGWLSSRNLLIGASALGGAGLFFGWNWLVAAGLASIIIGILPCLAMCAFGLCMSRMGKKTAPASAPAQLTETQSPDRPTA